MYSPMKRTNHKGSDPSIGNIKVLEGISMPAASGSVAHGS